MSGALNVIAVAGGMNVSANPTDVSGRGFPSATSEPVTVSISGGRAPYTGGWSFVAGDFMTVEGGPTVFTFSALFPEPAEVKFANYVYTVTDSSSPPIVKSSPVVSIVLEGS